MLVPYHALTSMRCRLMPTMHHSCHISGYEHQNSDWNPSHMLYLSSYYFCYLSCLPQHRCCLSILGNSLPWTNRGSTQCSHVRANNSSTTKFLLSELLALAGAISSQDAQCLLTVPISRHELAMACLASHGLAASITVPHHPMTQTTKPSWLSARLTMAATMFIVCEQNTDMAGSECPMPSNFWS